MISLTITVNNITGVMDIFDTIQIRRYNGIDTPEAPVSDETAFNDYVTVSGADTINDRVGVSDVLLDANYSQYYFTDPDGYSSDWYISRYYGSSNGSTSGWSDPIQGEPGDLYYNPQFPPEVAYGTADQLVIDRIRVLTGDPLGLRREYGEDALSSIHTDGKTYEMDETGWPAYVNMGGLQFSSTDNPSVNGYRYLRFKEYIDDICTTCSGYVGSCGEDVTKEVVNGADIWYYVFRRSDRQIMKVYDNCPPPSPLTTETANAEAYMLQTAVDLLRNELWEDAIEDGADISDEGSKYSPAPGLTVRRDLLKDLEKKLGDLIKAVMLSGITGVRVD